MRLNNVSAIFVFGLFLGCATKEVKIVTNPPAEVFVGSDFSSEYEKVGTAPVSIKVKDYAPNGFAYISVKAPNYSDHTLVLPEAYSQGSIEVNLNKLEEVEKIEERIKTSFGAQVKVLKSQLALQKQNFDEEKQNLETSFKGRSNSIFRKVMEVQNALHLKKMAKAAKALADLRALDPPEGLLLTLEGNFEFVNGKPKRAIASYRRALDLDPDNVELSGILKELKAVVR